MKEFTIFFVAQFTSYFVNTLDVRAIAHQQYLMALAVNAALPIIAWVMTKKITQCSNEWVGMTAVAIGGSLAAVFGMWLTARWG